MEKENKEEQKKGMSEVWVYTIAVAIVFAAVFFSGGLLVLALPWIGLKAMLS